MDSWEDDEEDDWDAKIEQAMKENIKKKKAESDSDTEEEEKPAEATPKAAPKKPKPKPKPKPVPVEEPKLTPEEERAKRKKELEEADLAIAEDLFGGGNLASKYAEEKKAKEVAKPVNKPKVVVVDMFDNVHLNVQADVEKLCNTCIDKVNKGKYKDAAGRFLNQTLKQLEEQLDMKELDELEKLLNGIAKEKKAQQGFDQQKEKKANTKMDKRTQWDAAKETEEYYGGGDDWTQEEWDEWEKKQNAEWEAQQKAEADKWKEEHPEEAAAETGEPQYTQEEIEEWERQQAQASSTGTAEFDPPPRGGSKKDVEDDSDSEDDRRRVKQPPKAAAAAWDDSDDDIPKKKQPEPADTWDDDDDEHPKPSKPASKQETKKQQTLPREEKAKKPQEEKKQQPAPREEKEKKHQAAEPEDDFPALGGGPKAGAGKAKAPQKETKAEQPKEQKATNSGAAKKASKSNGKK